MENGTGGLGGVQEGLKIRLQFRQLEAGRIEELEQIA